MWKTSYDTSLSSISGPTNHEPASSGVRDSRGRRRVGIGFATYHPGAYQVFAAYLQHAHPQMRKAALKAIAYHLWPESQPLLSEVVNTDIDPEKREYARPILEGSRQKYGERGAP